MSPFCLLLVLLVPCIAMPRQSGDLDSTPEESQRAAALAEVQRTKECREWISKASTLTNEYSENGPRQVTNCLFPMYGFMKALEEEQSGQLANPEKPKQSEEPVNLSLEDILVQALGVKVILRTHPSCFDEYTTKTSNELVNAAEQIEKLCKRY